MNSENELLSYGQYLKQVRVEQNISLERVSQLTRISIHMLELIENEAEEKLPEDLYVRNFIRQYARALGIDEQDAVGRYGGKANAPKIKLEIYKPLPIIDRKLGVYLFAAAVLVVALIGWLIMSFSGDTGRAPAPEMEKQVQATAPVVTDEEKPEVMPSGEAFDMPSKAKGEDSPKWLLHAKAIEKTWMKVIVDGQSPIEYMLDVNEEINLEAETGFDLLIGNAGGIRLELNGKYVNVPGRSGQVASLKIP